MSKIYTEIFDQQRLEVWHRLKEFNNLGALAGGTALALQLKHRKSYDFDIFCNHQIPSSLLLKLKKIFWEYQLEPQIDTADELTVFLSGQIKLSFIFFPFPKLENIISTDSISLYSVNDLLANKAYAVGRRGAWRDYVDIFWAISHRLSNLNQIIQDSETKFDGVFNQKLFLEQLTYFDDLQENEVDWLSSDESNQKIKIFLTETVKKFLKTSTN